MKLEDTPCVCDVCGKPYMGDGYQWTCDECKSLGDCPVCGSDDTVLDWHIVNDQNGELSPTPVWAGICNWCEAQTAYFETAREAANAWYSGAVEKVMTEKM